MPYIGRELDRGNYLKLDDISSSFDGSTTTFNLTNGGNAFYPGSAFSILVVLAGVVQEPEAAYQINQTQITFASAPLAGDQFFCIVLGQALGVNTPANGSVNGTQLAKPFSYDNYFYLDDANNRVGVGTATPMTPLHVEGTGRFTNVTVTGDLTVEGTTTTLDTVVTEVDKLEVGANNSTVGVAITQSGSGDAAIFMGGNVGINKASPSRYLEIGGTSNNPQIRLSNGAGTSSLEVLGNAASGQEIRFGTEASPQAGRIIYHNNDNSLRYSNTGGERLRVTSAGNLGIKNTSPNNTLTVGDTVQPSYAPSSAGNYIEIARTSGADAGLLINKNTGQWLVGIDNSDGANAPLRFEYGAAGSAHPGFGAGTLGMIIKHDGKIGIGSDNPQSQFEVYGTSPIIRSKHKTSQKYTQINHNGTDGYVDWSSGGLIFRGASNTERLRITSGGGLKFISADSPTSTTEPAQILNHSGGWQFYGSSGTSTHRNIIFCSASNAASERLRITSDGKVGIGTDSLGHRFTVYGPNTVARFQSSTSYVDLMFQNTGATNGFIQYNNGGNFRFYANSGSTPTLVITSGAPGNVGIGEDSPDVRLHVKEQFDTAYSLTSVTTDSNHLLKLENPSTTANAFAGMQFRVGSGADLYIGAIQQSVNHGDFFFANQNSPQKEMMRIKSTGLVGIGTNDPSSPLHLQSTSTNQNVLTISANNARTAHIRSPQVSDSNTPFTFYTNNAWRFDIDSIRVLTMTHDYKVGIGTDNPDTQLQVFGSPTTGQFKVGGGNGAGNHRVYINCSETNSYIDSYGNNGYRKLRINAAPLLLNDTGGGNVGIGTNNADKKLRVEGDARVTGTLTIASTVIDGSIDYPTIRPVLDLNFATNKFLDDRITFRRDSIATYYGADGLLKYASINEPRFPYDPDTGESLGLLIEDPGTNLISGSGGYGSDIRNGTNLGNAPTSTVVDGITLPDGTVGKVRRIQIHPSGNSGMRWGSTGGGNINTPYSASVWARAVSGTASFSIDANDNGTASYTLTEEWVRMQCTGTTSEGAYQFMDLMGNAGHDAYFWGFQLENNGLVTSYIPVESHMSNNTRANDVAYITGENFTDFYNQSEGTLVLSADIAYLPTSNQAAVVFEDTSSESTDLIALGYRVGGGSSGNLGSWYQGNGSSVAYLNHNAGITANTEFRQAFAYKKDNLASSVNGGTPQTDNSGTLSTSIDRVKFGGYYADTMKSGHIRYFKYFNKRLSNAQLQGLTSQ